MPEYDEYDKNISLDNFKVEYWWGYETISEDTRFEYRLDKFTNGIYWAVRNDRIDIFKYLLTINVYERKRLRESYLKIIISDDNLLRNGNQSLYIQVILEYGIDPNHDFALIYDEPVRISAGQFQNYNTYFRFTFVPRIHLRSLELLLLYGFYVNTRSTLCNILFIYLDIHMLNNGMTVCWNDNTSDNYNTFNEQVRLLIEFGISIEATFDCIKLIYHSFTKYATREATKLFNKHQKPRKRRLRELLHGKIN